MADVTLGGNPVHTSGELPAVGTPAPSFTLTATDMSAIHSGDFAGQQLVLSIFPSIGTGTCAASVRAFNQHAAAVDNTTVLCVSADLPFAQAAFCGAEGIEHVVMGSTFKNPEFLTDYGVLFTDGKFEGLAARSIVVVDADGTVKYTELVPEVANEPDYDAALAALD